MERETISLSKRFNQILASDEYKDKPDAYKDRNWSMFGYPDSFPECEEWFMDSGLPHYIALHDSCLMDDGSLKKAHWHIILKFPGPKSLKQLKMLLDPRLVRLEPVTDIRGAVRYLVHADSPDKHQYDKSIIHGNLDYEQYFRKKIKGYNPADLIAILDENPQICTIRGLCGYAISKGDNSLLNFISKRTYFVKQLFDSPADVSQVCDAFASARELHELRSQFADLKDFVGVPADD